MNHDDFYRTEVVFSQARIEKFVYKYFHLFGWCAVVFIIITVFVRREVAFNFYGTILIIFLSLIVFFYEWFIRKNAYKIIIDFKKQTILFCLYRAKKIVKIGFKDLQKIRVNGYVVFFLKDKKIIYKDLDNNGLFEYLDKIKKIEWGFLCFIWGPPKRIRDRLSERIGTGLEKESGSP